MREKWADRNRETVKILYTVLNFFELWSNPTHYHYVYSDSLWVIVPQNYESVKRWGRIGKYFESLSNTQNKLLLLNTPMWQFNADISHYRQWIVYDINNPHSKPVWSILL